MHIRSNLRDNLIIALALDGDQSFDGDLDYKTPPFEPTAEAAVLALINAHNNTITLTKRQSHMRKHAGQVAFAGGRKDDTDPSLWHTALREANEEIGLPLDHPLEQIGSLPLHMTITHFAVTPFIALNPEPFEYKAQPSEVAEIFELPITQLHPENFRIDSRDYQGQKRSFYVLPYQDYYIWGATARMLHNLANRLDHVNR